MLETRNVNGVIVVKLNDTDRLNSFITEPVKEHLLELFKKPNMNVIFDLGGIRFIDSSGFAVFLTAMKAANNNFGKFKLCNTSKEVMELFKVLQLHHVFEMFDKLDAGLASFTQ